MKTLFTKKETQGTKALGFFQNGNRIEEERCDTKPTVPIRPHIEANAKVGR